MLDNAGTLQRLVVSRTLWLIFAWPLAGLAWQLLVVRPRVARAADAQTVARELGSARVVGFGCIALAATATAGHALLLARLPEGSRALFEPLARGPRFGDLDAGIELLLDTRALAACGLACLVTLGAASLLASRPAAERGWPTWAWLQLALAGALVSFLSDGFPTLAVGWTLAAAAGAWLAGWHDAGAGVVVATRGVAALSAMLLGAALLFWGLGGSWDDDDFAPDGKPHVAAISGAMGSGDASVTMTGLAGALVFVDDERTSTLRSPFLRVPLAPGSHRLRIQPGDGAEDATLARLDVIPGQEITLLPLGPTLSFHSMLDELDLRTPGGPQPVRRAAEEHLGPGGFAVLAGALLTLLGASAAMSAWSPSLAAPRVLVGVMAGATTAALGPFLLIRLAFLFPSARHGALAVASVGAAVFLSAIWQALGTTGLRRWLVFIAGAPAGLTYIALGLGDVGAALGVMVVAGAAAAAACVAAARWGKDAAVASDGATRRSDDDALLSRVPVALGDLLVRMEHGVVQPVISSMGMTARIAAWTASRADEHLVSKPADVAASGLLNAVRRLEPWLGLTPARLAWALLAAAALVAFVHAAWLRG